MKPSMFLSKSNMRYYILYVTVQLFMLQVLEYPRKLLTKNKKINWPK